MDHVKSMQPWSALLLPMKHWVTLMLWGLLLSPGMTRAQAYPIIERFPFEVVVDITWRGLEIQIRKVLACNFRRTPSSSGGTETRWGLDINQFYYVLPSREVLIFELPSICGGLNDIQQRILTVVPQDFLPLTRWVDNADSPQEAEYIVSHRYFTDNPYRRFEMRKFQILEATNLADRIDDDQRLAGLIRSSELRFDSVFAGMRSVHIPRSVWERYTALVKELNSYTGNQILEFDLLRRTAVALHGRCENQTVGIRAEKYCPYHAGSYVFGALLDQGVWLVRDGDVGVMRFFRYQDVDKMDTTGCLSVIPHCNIEKHIYRFEVDGYVHERPVNKSAVMFFNFNTQTIQWVSFMTSRSTINSERQK
ncbi:MAG: hypothetical protein EXR27_09935 [Betaproteobacteria bacterium]|nr:hypothetical protein [Betaproteobacteria bacterium]